MVNTRPKLRPYHYRNVYLNLSYELGRLCNRAWQYMTKVRLTEGDKKANELEEAIRFMESIREDCKALAW